MSAAAEPGSETVSEGGVAREQSTVTAEREPVWEVISCVCLAACH